MEVTGGAGLEEVSSVGIDGDSNGKAVAGRVSVWAAASACLAVLPFLLLEIHRPAHAWFLWGIVCVPWVLAMIVGVIALVEIGRGGGRVRGRALAAAGIGIPVAYVAFMMVAGYNLQRLVHGPMAQIRACQENMRQLHAALREYADGHDGLLPQGAGWCDALLTETAIEPGAFVCPCLFGTGRETTYVLNERAAGCRLDAMPRDVVLLFEGSVGWNQVGGSASASGGHHVVVKMCYVNVLTARGRAEHLMEDKMTDLRWE